MSTVGIHGGTASGGSGQTDTEARATQVATGTIDANGESVTLELNGATGAAAYFTNNSFSGTVRFYTSTDGSNFFECQAHQTFTAELVNREHDGVNPTRIWAFVLFGGETHVRITSVTYTSGSLDVRLTGTYTVSNPLAAALSHEGDLQRAIGSIAIAGSRSTGHYPISANTGSELLSDSGLIVRNVTAVQSEGGAAGGAAYRNLVAGVDPDNSLVRTLQLDDADPTGTEHGVIVRNIPSGTQNVADGGGSLTIDNATLSVVGGGTEATALRVTVASDSTGVLSIDDNGGSLTVDGTVTANQGGAPWLQRFNPSTASALTEASINAALSGDNTLVSGTGGQTIRVHKIFLVVASDVSIIFKDGAGTNLTGTITMKSGGAIVLDFDAEPWFTTSSGNAFVLNLSGAIQASGRVYYTKS